MRGDGDLLLNLVSPLLRAAVLQPKDTSRRISRNVTLNVNDLDLFFVLADLDLDGLFIKDILAGRIFLMF
ncbi:MAG: hypothetical protein ACK5QX_00435, partial [bacterium]